MMRGVVSLTVALMLLPAIGLAEYVGNLNPKGDNYLTLRQYSDAKSKSLSRMGPDTVVTVLDRDGDWLYVETADGRIGWAFGKYILPGLPASDTARAAPTPPPPAAFDPFDWVEGHLMTYHSPLVYYP